MPKSSTLTRSPPAPRVGDEEDVLRLEIAVDDALLVRGGERRWRSGARCDDARRRRSAALRDASRVGEVSPSRSSMTRYALPSAW